MYLTLQFKGVRIDRNQNRSQSKIDKPVNCLQVAILYRLEIKILKFHQSIYFIVTFNTMI